MLVLVVVVVVVSKIVVVVALDETCAVDLLLRLEVTVVGYKILVTSVLINVVGIFFITFVT